MPTHFDALGFPANNEAELHELLLVAFHPENEGSEGPVEHADGRSATYRDPSGATLTAHLDRRGNLVCCQPGFEGPFHARWRPLNVVRDQDCRFCDLVYAELLDDGDRMIYPFALTVETLGAQRALIPYTEPGEVRFVGLWEEGEVWPDEATFERAQEAWWGDVPAPDALDEVRDAVFASRSLIPWGTYGGAMTSHVIARGFVAAVEERFNRLGGAPFRVVRLDTLGGVFDTCLAPETLEREELLVPGAVAQATLWLVGRPLTLRDQPGPVPEAGERDEDERSRSSFLGRLFRRLVP